MSNPEKYRPPSLIFDKLIAESLFRVLVVIGGKWGMERRSMHAESGFKEKRRQPVVVASLEREEGEGEIRFHAERQSIYIYIYIVLHIHIYLYRERERERGVVS